jgi:hypothetical protein
MEIVVRFILGGLIVTAFAVLGDVLKPRTFSGIFCAAPSVALATLGLTYAMKGPSTASLEGEAMVIGAVAFFAYLLPINVALKRGMSNALVMSITSWIAWLAVAFGLWGLLLR